MGDMGWTRGWYKRISGEERKKKNEIEIRGSRPNFKI